jgi:hypothetical protein
MSVEIPQSFSSLHSVLNRNLVFVHGKGGVGKTVVSRAIATCLAQKSQKTLWVTVQDPNYPHEKITSMAPHLWHLNCDFNQAFEEYAAMKIGAATLTRIFLNNKVTQHLARAAPGIHELVLLGKIWHERNHYTHVVVDLPSTGYGLAMFQSTENFSKLFRGGPLHRDANDMLRTFRDPEKTGHVILALPEEMPLVEALDLNGFLSQILPGNPPAFIANRVFPETPKIDTSISAEPNDWQKPFASSSQEYCSKRYQLEQYNLRIWKEANLEFKSLEFVPPPVQNAQIQISQGLAEQLKDKGYL